MGLSDIKNEQILKFREKLLGYNLEFIHVKGSTNSMADRLVSGMPIFPTSYYN